MTKNSKVKEIRLQLDTVNNLRTSLLEELQKAQAEESINILLPYVNTYWKTSYDLNDGFYDYYYIYSLDRKSQRLKSIRVSPCLEDESFVIQSDFFFDPTDIGPDSMYTVSVEISKKEFYDQFKTVQDSIDKIIS